ncbi:hypothetical protein ACFSO7_09640 [Bacillus sp. CGMCC 1.16607]|uniref:hypothetical protein n=1 Tax=Bacillus sp. CGMCC 1.16607 TaxID=3351842 RepID=UPI00362AED02
MKPAFTDKIMINVPKLEVFEFISDLRNGSKMNEDILSVEKLTEGPIEIGTKFKETKIIRGRNTEATIEVIEYTSLKAFSATSEANGLKVTYHYHLSEIPNGTLVNFQCEIKTSGIIMFITKPFITKIIIQEESDRLINIKRALES